MTLLRKNGIIKYIFLIASGVLTGLTLVFTRLGFLEWVSIVPAAAVIIQLASDKAVKYKTIYKCGFVYFMSFYMTGFHWFVALYPLSFISGMTNGVAAFIVIFAWVGLSLLQAIASSFVPVIIALAARRPLCQRYKLIVPLCAGAVYAVFEWLQTLTWAGVPWSRLAIGQTELSAMIKSASLFGSYFITFIIVAVNFYLALAWISESKQQKRICASLGAIIIAVNASVGGVLIVADENNGEPITSAAIQPNISSHEKWSGSLYDIKLALETHAMSAAEEGAELIVFSETVYPYELLNSETSRDFFSELAVKCDATLVVGCFTSDEEGEYNSLIFIEPNGAISETVYSKRHLVPFGEYVPLRKLVMTIVPPLAELSMLGEDLSEGKDAAIFDGEIGAIGGLICFDSIYETLALESVRSGAEIISLSTNDSWFLDSAGVKMHNAQAKLRAVECGRYIVRSANTGISSVIDHNGNTLDEKEALVDGYVIADIYPRNNRTLYSYIGNVVVLLSAAFVVWLIFAKNNKV